MGDFEANREERVSEGSQIVNDGHAEKFGGCGPPVKVLHRSGCGSGRMPCESRRRAMTPRSL